MAKVVKASSLTKVARGRKAEINPVLVELLTKLGEGSAVILDEEFGSVPTAKRSTVSAIIRRHWKATGRSDNASISYSPEGFAQVEARG